MNHITKAAIKKATEEHHMLGDMISQARSNGMNKAIHKKATEEHHFLGNLIGMFSKGLGMAAPYLSRGIKGLSAIGGGLARNASNIGHAVNAAGSIAQMRQAQKAAEAQQRMMNAQAQGVEDQNTYNKRQMEAVQAQKRGGRTRSCR